MESANTLEFLTFYDLIMPHRTAVEYGLQIGAAGLPHAKLRRVAHFFRSVNVSENPLVGGAGHECAVENAHVLSWEEQVADVNSELSRRRLNFPSLLGEVVGVNAVVVL